MLLALEIQDDSKLSVTLLCVQVDLVEVWWVKLFDRLWQRLAAAVSCTVSTLEADCGILLHSCEPDLVKFKTTKQWNPEKGRVKIITAQLMWNLTPRVPSKGFRWSETWMVLRLLLPHQPEQHLRHMHSTGWANLWRFQPPLAHNIESQCSKAALRTDWSLNSAFLSHGRS